MWRKLFDSFRKIQSTVVMKPVTIITKESSIPSLTNVNTKWIDENKLSAHKNLQDAIKELSKDDSLAHPSSTNITLLKQWINTPIKDLSIEQLEELARAWYEGVDNVVSKDTSKSLEIWSEAANRGSVEAKYSRAICIREGVGTDKDSSVAFSELMHIAENNNYNLAHYTVALMLLNGEGVIKDESKAFLHFKLAAKGGVQPALHNIGNCYAYGRGVKQSDYNAILYYEAAAEAGDPYAQFTLGTWVSNGRGCDVNKEKSFDLQLKAANSGHPAAMYNIGVAYMSGDGVEKDLLKASEWFEKAGNMNIIEANINLGNMYREGYGVNKDLQKAYNIFNKFADKNEVCKQLLDDVKNQMNNSNNNNNNNNNI